MEALAAEYFDLLVETVGGRRTRGEHAGHAQVSVWRNWRQTDTSRLAELRARQAPDGMPLPVVPPAGLPDVTLPPFALAANPDGRGATERIGLILPTSLCSTQIARMAAERLNAGGLARAAGLSRFLGFTHTEGCGFGGETMYRLLHRTYRGYLTHPNVAAALLLEHGCEKVPNDVMRHHLSEAGVDPARFGWASVQLDGGIDRAIGRVEAWFAERLAASAPVVADSVPRGGLNLAVLSAGAVDLSASRAFASVARAVLAAGGSVLLAEGDPLLAAGPFRAALLGETAPRATLAYGEPLKAAGLHVIASETDHWVENLTGLCACGAHLAVGLVRDHARQGHPMMPVIQFAAADERGTVAAEDIDGFFPADPAAAAAQLAEWMGAVVSGARQVAAQRNGAVDFQLTRGLLGLTT
jgi:altronate dehydratase